MEDPFLFLSESELDWLDNFLLERIDEDEDTQERDEGVLGISELDGLLTAIVSGPTLVMPSQWLPVVWGDYEPLWKDDDELEKVLSLMVRHSNDIAGTLMESPEEYEPIFLERDIDGETYTIVDEWCRGYMRGVALAMDHWDAGGEEVMTMLLPIMMFTSQKGLDMLENMNDEEVEQMQQAIPICAQDIHAWWLDRRGGPGAEDDFDDEDYDDELEDEGLYESAYAKEDYENRFGKYLAGLSEPYADLTPDVGGNDLCPCGSGKKFKKCCLH